MFGLDNHGDTVVGDLHIIGKTASVSLRARQPHSANALRRILATGNHVTRFLRAVHLRRDDTFSADIKNFLDFNGLLNSSFILTNALEIAILIA